MTGTTPSQLDLDLACVACGYNLRGLESEAKCPECGRAVRATLDGLVRNWDEATTERILRALRWLARSWWRTLFLVLTVVFYLFFLMNLVNELPDPVVALLVWSGWILIGVPLFLIWPIQRAMAGTELQSLPARRRRDRDWVFGIVFALAPGWSIPVGWLAPILIASWLQPRSLAFTALFATVLMIAFAFAWLLHLNWLVGVYRDFDWRCPRTGPPSGRDETGVLRGSRTGLVVMGIVILFFDGLIFISTQGMMPPFIWLLGLAILNIANSEGANRIIRAIEAERKGIDRPPPAATATAASPEQPAS